MPDRSFMALLKERKIEDARAALDSEKQGYAPRGRASAGSGSQLGHLRPPTRCLSRRSRRGAGLVISLGLLWLCASAFA